MKTALMAAIAVFFYAHPLLAQEKPFLAGQATVTMSATGSSTAVQIQTGASNPNLRIYNGDADSPWHCRSHRLRADARCRHYGGHGGHRVPDARQRAVGHHNVV